jgi:predicted RNA-binding protein with PIN domain
VEEPTVFVDARNVIRSRWPNLREDRFLGLTRTWAEREGVHAVVVFDGRAPGNVVGASELDERTRVVGTGGGTADDWIAHEAERVAGEGHRVWLVSSDRGLRDRVAPYVERTIGGGTFAGRLEELERLSAE